jgi:cyclophilin family peptidyl-prolyl cis-trans isomerase
MPSAKRERQREGRLVRAAAEAAEKRRRQRWKTVRNFGFIVAAIVAVIFVLSLRSGSDNKAPVSVSSDSGGSTSSTTPAPLSITIPAAGASITGDTPCPAADGTSARTTTFAKAPPMCVDPAKTYTATVETSKGTFAIALDVVHSPNTVNNFVVLSRYHFFDGVAFHRIIPGFVDQVGDATGPTPGQGGPGYTIPDELPTDASPYPEGVVAMANNSTPNTSGSQWFVVIGTGGSTLTATYNRLGRVESGLDVATAINAAGGSDGKPTEQITITKVTITEA